MRTPCACTSRWDSGARVASRRGCARSAADWKRTFRWRGYAPRRRARLSSQWDGDDEVALKRALIVDDSKSARVVLSRMLQKYNIEVDTAENAETAIDYLVQNRPDVIFMDHLMPGMDGFQAVQAIKNNPRTATIPIMMYTSQEGELYVGQARALGAVGVLPKLVKPVDVSKVLYQLHLLPERRDYTPPAFIA